MSLRPPATVLTSPLHFRSFRSTCEKPPDPEGSIQSPGRPVQEGTRGSERDLTSCSQSSGTRRGRL